MDRYNLEMLHCVECGLEKDNDGKWVKYKDFEQLQAENKELKMSRDLAISRHQETKAENKKLKDSEEDSSIKLSKSTLDKLKLGNRILDLEAENKELKKHNKLMKEISEPQFKTPGEPKQ